MSSSGLDWKPVAEAWLKKRSGREKEVFMNLFQHSFEELYTWGTQNVVLTMKVLQCNIVLQVGVSKSITSESCHGVNFCGRQYSV